MSEQADNVIILGAGASFDAGIPLMSNFIDTMWNLARTGRGPDGPIYPADRKILENALGVREDLDGYHGRASFDMWNIVINERFHGLPFSPLPSSTRTGALA